MLYNIPLDKYTTILFNQDATDRDLGGLQYFAIKQTSTNDILHLCKYIYGINFHKWDYWIVHF